MLVKDVMSSPVITVKDVATVDEVAQIMDSQKRGCAIVTDKDGRPLGIITERDLVVRVVARNIKPDTLRAGDVMTSPLITIESDSTLTEAARQMRRLNIRRLGVTYKEQMIGIISSKDILGVIPELIEIIQEKTQIESGNLEHMLESPLIAGYCDRCGQWSNRLKEVEGDFLCENCRTESEA